MISRIIDVTEEFNRTNRARLDLSGWGSATFQFLNPSTTIDFTGTNDGGEETGTLNPSPATSGNFSAIQVVNLATGTSSTTTSGTGMYRLIIPCKYIQIFGVGATALKILIFVNKPGIAL